MRRLAWVFVALAAGAVLFWLSRSERLDGARLAAVPVEDRAAREHATVRGGLLAGEVKPGSGTGTIQGLVSNREGPVAGATLIAVRVDAEENLAELLCGSECFAKTVHCGSAVAGAQVAEWVRTRRGEAPPVARSTSAADGTFELRGLDPGAHRIWALADGQGVALAKKVLTGATDADLEFGELVAVAGKVVDGEGRPIAGVWVTGFHPDFPRYFDAQTKADGTFDFGKLPSGHLSLVASRSAALFAHEHGPLNPPRRSFELKISPPLERTVRVVSEGKPAPGATVSARQGRHPLRTWTADDQGTARIQVPAKGSTTLVASLGSACAAHDVGRDDSQADPIVLELMPASWVSGTVHDESGRPVPRARISVDGRGFSDERSDTDVEGRFRVGPIPQPGLVSTVEGTIRITAEADGFATTTQTGAMTQGRESQHALTLRRAQALTGRVLSPDGKPLADAQVTLSRSVEDPLSSLHQDAATTGDQGAFTFTGLGAGSAKLTAKHPRWGSAEADVTVPAAGVELRMKAGAEVDVLLVDERNLPLRMSVALLRDVDVTARRADIEEPRDLHSERDGHAIFRGVSPGSWLIIAGIDRSASVRATSTLQLEEGERKSVRLVVAEGLKIEGIVVDENGKPIAAQRVTAQLQTAEALPPSTKTSQMLQQLGGMASASSDAQGRFVLEHLKPGSYLLQAFTNGARAEATAATGAVGVRLTVPAERVVIGRVVDAQNRPVTRFELNGKKFEAPTGEFRDGLFPGRSSLVVTAAGLPPRSVPVPARDSDGVFDVGTVVMTAGRALKVLVSDRTTSRPLKGVMVFSRVGIDATPPMTAEDGTVTLAGVPSDTKVVIAARLEGYSGAEAIAEAEANEVRIGLERAAVLEGSVLMSDGGPAAWATVALTSLDGGHRSDTGTQVDGRYLFPEAPPGTFNVTFNLGAGRLKPPPSLVTLIAGTTVRLDAREPAGAVSVTLKFVGAGGAPAMVSGTLVPGTVAVPTSMESFRAAAIAGQRVRPFTGEGSVLPGSYTVIGMFIVGMDKMFVFVEPLTVTSAPNQSYTIRVPTKAIELQRPPRP